MPVNVILIFGKDLLGGRLEESQDALLQAQASLCYICAGNVEKVVSCWTRAQAGYSPLSLQVGPHLASLSQLIVTLLDYCSIISCRDYLCGLLYCCCGWHPSVLSMFCHVILAGYQCPHETQSTHSVNVVVQPKNTAVCLRLNKDDFIVHGSIHPNFIQTRTAKSA